MPRGGPPTNPGAPGEGRVTLVSVWAAGNPLKSPVCLPFLHPRSPHGFARSRSRSLSPAVPASVPRSTPSWCRRGTWRKATSWAEVRETPLVLLGREGSGREGAKKLCCYTGRVEWTKFSLGIYSRFGSLIYRLWLIKVDMSGTAIYTGQKWAKDI